MIIVTKLLKNRNAIFLVAILLGLTIGGVGAEWTRVLVLPALAVVMTVSIVTITSSELASLRSVPYPVFLSLLLNYFVLGGIMLVMAWWLIDDTELWVGFVILAAVPPAVAVIPFSYALGGNTAFSLRGMIGTYLVALVLTPAVIMIFLGVGFLNPAKLLLVLGQLIVAPIIASRILLLAKLSQHVNKWRGTVVNWGFFIVFFTVIGLNQQIFLKELDVIVRIAIIGFTATFIVGYTIKQITRALRIEHSTSVSLLLMSTQKNAGLANGIALSLFSDRASAPGAIVLIFAILYVVWLGFSMKKPT